VRGPQPKDPQVRQRRNRAVTAAELEAEAPLGEPPPLPRRPRRRSWTERTRVWWDRIWRSPMASRFLEADIDQLFILAELVDRFWREPTTALAAEIRQHRTAFGLTPIDRRRLEWTIRPPAEDNPAPARTSSPRAEVSDPRESLRIVKAAT